MKRKQKTRYKEVKPELIRSKDDVVGFIEQLNEENGPGWHPDTPFEEMVSLKTNLPAYSRKDASARNFAIERAFQLCGDDLYTLAIETWQKRGWAPRPDDDE